MTPATRKSFKNQLHDQLADATTLVWKSQNALSEQGGAENVDEIVVTVQALAYRIGVILGHVTRWQKLEQDDERRDEDECTPRDSRV